MKNENAQNIRACKALEAIADLLNAALHTEIANAAQADAAQCEANEIAAENAPIDFVAVYIDGKPNKAASTYLMHTQIADYISYFTNPDLATNTAVKFNGDILYLEETSVETCYQHGETWEFWAHKSGEPKRLLMIHLRTSPIKARKVPRNTSEWYDNADFGDGYTHEDSEVLNF